MIHEVKDILLREKPDCILLRGDRHIGFETSLIKVANSMAIPTIIIPHAISDPNGIALQRYLSQHFLNDYSKSKLFNKIIFKLYPSWFYKFQDDYVLFYQSEKCLAAKISGIMPKNVWSLGGGQSSRMACEGSFMYEQMKKQGVPKKKLVITGKASNDILNKKINCKEEKKIIKKAHGLKHSDFILVFSVPNHFEHKYLTKREHFSLLDEIAKIICQPKKIKIVLTLHPKSKKTDYEKYAKKNGMIVSDYPYYELLTIADMYLATMSSTILLSCSLNVLTIVENFMAPVNEGPYKNLPNLHIANSLKDLEIRFLKGLNIDKNIKGSINHCKLSTMIDGKSTSRLESLIKNMIRNNE